MQTLLKLNHAFQWNEDFNKLLSILFKDPNDWYKQW